MRARTLWVSLATLVCSFVLNILACSPALAAETGTLSGKVTFSDGGTKGNCANPVMVLSRTTGDNVGVPRVTGDAEGNYSFKDIGVGIVTVMVESCAGTNGKSYRSPSTNAWVQPITIKAGQTATQNFEVSESFTKSKVECDAGALSWIVCNLIKGLVGAIDFIRDNIIVPLFRETPLDRTDPNVAPAYALWSAFRNVASVFFILIFFLVIFGTAIGWDNYTIKKVLPRLVAGAIFVPFSWYICVVAIDIGNVLGQGVVSLFESIPYTATVDFTTPLTSVFVAGGALLGVAGGIVALTNISLVGLITIAVAFGVAFLALLFRKIAILLLVILSPLALLAWILPNTSKWFQQWYINLFKLILMYPLIMLLFEVARLFAAAAGAVFGTSDLAKSITPLIQLVVLALPVGAIPFTFGWAGGVMKMGAGAAGRVGSGINSRWGKGSDFDKARAEARTRKALINERKGQERGGFLGKTRMFYNRSRSGTGGGFAGLGKGNMERQLAHSEAFSKAAKTVGKYNAQQNAGKYLGPNGKETLNKRLQAEEAVATRELLQGRATRTGTLSALNGVGTGNAHSAFYDAAQERARRNIATEHGENQVLSANRGAFTPTQIASASRLQAQTKEMEAQGSISGSLDAVAAGAGSIRAQADLREAATIKARADIAAREGAARAQVTVDRTGSSESFQQLRAAAAISERERAAAAKGERSSVRNVGRSASESTQDLIDVAAENAEEKLTAAAGQRRGTLKAAYDAQTLAQRANPTMTLDQINETRRQNRIELASQGAEDNALAAEGSRSVSLQSGREARNISALEGRMHAQDVMTAAAVKAKQAANKAAGERLGAVDAAGEQNDHQTDIAAARANTTIDESNAAGSRRGAANALRTKSVDAAELAAAASRESANRLSETLNKAEGINDAASSEENKLIPGILAANLGMTPTQARALAAQQLIRNAGGAAGVNARNAFIASTAAAAGTITGSQAAVANEQERAQREEGRTLTATQAQANLDYNASRDASTTAANKLVQTSSQQQAAVASREAAVRKIMATGKSRQQAEAELYANAGSKAGYEAGRRADQTYGDESGTVAGIEDDIRNDLEDHGEDPNTTDLAKRQAAADRVRANTASAAQREGYNRVAGNSSVDAGIAQGRKDAEAVIRQKFEQDNGRTPTPEELDRLVAMSGYRAGFESGRAKPLEGTGRDIGATQDFEAAIAKDIKEQNDAATAAGLPAPDPKLARARAEQNLAYNKLYNAAINTGSKSAQARAQEQGTVQGRQEVVDKNREEDSTLTAAQAEANLLNTTARTTADETRLRTAQNYGTESGEEKTSEAAIELEAQNTLDEDVRLPYDVKAKDGTLYKANTLIPKGTTLLPNNIPSNVKTISREEAQRNITRQAIAAGKETGIRQQVTRQGNIAALGMASEGGTATPEDRLLAQTQVELDRAAADTATVTARKEMLGTPMQHDYQTTVQEASRTQYETILRGKVAEAKERTIPIYKSRRNPVSGELELDTSSGKLEKVTDVRLAANPMDRNSLTTLAYMAREAKDSKDEATLRAVMQTLGQSDGGRDMLAKLRFELFGGTPIHEVAPNKFVEDFSIHATAGEDLELWKKSTEGVNAKNAEDLIKPEIGAYKNVTAERIATMDGSGVKRYLAFIDRLRESARNEPDQAKAQELLKRRRTAIEELTNSHNAAINTPTIEKSYKKEAKDAVQAFLNQPDMKSDTAESRIKFVRSRYHLDPLASEDDYIF